jgi:hypothetical protein
MIPSRLIGWAYEMQAWYCLTQGDYRGTIHAATAGQAAAAQRPHPRACSSSSTKSPISAGHPHPMYAECILGV